MGRPRKHGQIQYSDFRWSLGKWDPDARYVPIRAEANIDLDLPEGLREKWRRQMGIYTNQPRQHLYERSPATPYRPFGFAVVVDAILRMDPRSSIVGAEFASELNEHYPFFTFNEISTGKILTALMKEAYQQQHEVVGPPIIHHVSGGTTFYYAHDNTPSWIWLVNCREWLGNVSEQWMSRYDETGKWPEEDFMAEFPDHSYDRLDFTPPDRAPRRRSR